MPFLALFVLFCGDPVFAADKNGVSPSKISVPKGPGSIEGLGESFQPTLNTGTAKYAVAIKLPPGTAGLDPGLKLVYEGGAANGPLGFGWEFSFDFVQYRTDHGIPTYGQVPGFPRADNFITDAKEELVPKADGYYFCKNEGAFTRYRQLSNHWESTLPNGTRLEFGFTDLGRIQGTSSVPARVFSWLIERETDTHGNTILYTYASFPGETNLNQRYLSGIAYGPGAPPWSNFHFVRFLYEDRPDWFEDCRAGFPVRTGKRLKSIVIGTQGPTLAGHQHGDFNNDGTPDNLNRIYELGYAQYAGLNSHWSFLGSIQPIGADGVSRLPASTFAYTVADPPAIQSAAGKLILGTNEPPFVMDNTLVDFVDANGDALPDLLKTEAGGGTHTVYLNRGVTNTAGQRSSRWGPPVEIGGDLQAQVFRLSQDSVHLADMDGDGLADLVARAAFDQIFYFPNRGKTAWNSRLPMAILDFPPPSPFGETNVRTADLDFDKRTDILRSDGTEYQLWCNLGHGQYSARITVPQTNYFDFALPQVQIADFNGDRVPDVAWVRPTEVIVTAGLGYAKFLPPVHVPVADFPGGGPRYLTSDLMARAKLEDINGDGLADLVIERVPGNELWCWLNHGNYSLRGPLVITDMPDAIGANAAVRWADLNGNGTADLIYADTWSTPRLRAVDIGELFNGGPVAHALVGITNGIGGVTVVGYQSSTAFALQDATAGQPWPDPVPFPVNVVSSVTNFDTLGHQYVTLFSYHNGYYDPAEHQFRGFGRVEQTDIGDSTAPTLVSQSIFDTGRTYEIMKGRLLAAVSRPEGGGVFSTETNSYSLPPISLFTGTNGTNVAYTYPTANVKVISELGQGAPKRLEAEFAYDLFGNQTTNISYGIVEGGDRSAGNDERVTVSQYAINTNAWILRAGTRQELRSLDGVTISRAENYYDDETFSGGNFGLITLGNLTLSRAWTNAANPAAYINSVRTKYDGYGNPLLLLDPLAAAPGGSVDFSKGHAREIAFDSRFRTFPVTETIHLGQVGSGVLTGPLVFQAAYDEGFGTVSSAFDFNTNQTTFGYDVFARLVSIVKPYDTTNYPTAEYDYAMAVPVGTTGVVNYVETRGLDRSPGSAGAKRNHYLIARQFVDGLGRALLAKSEAEPAPGSSTPRVVVSGATLYNARGKPVSTLNPSFSLMAGATMDNLLVFENIESPGWQGQFEQNGTLVTLALANAHRSHLVYDAALRNLRHTNADGTFGVTVYEPLLVRSFDENQTDPASAFFGASMVHYNDGLGRLVQVDEVTRLNDDGTPAGTLIPWSTRYEYDLNDNLTKITDSQNNVKTMAFDSLKRMMFMDDPDRGHLTYAYDAAGNVLQSTDAKGQVIRHTYDGVNRLLTEDYLDEGQPFSANKSYNPSLPITPTNRPDVVYLYDLPTTNLDQGDNTTATAHNIRGALAYVWDLSGEEHSSFDARGRVEYTVKRIPDPVLYPTLQGSNAPADPQLVSWKTAFIYDSADSVVRLVYPDKDEVTYQYNERGLLQRIPGGPSGSIISNIVYKPSAQQSAIDYGNGVRTTYDYDSRLRLTSLLTVSKPSTLNRQLINFQYAFDNISNIRQISDNRPAAVVPEGDKRRNTQLFQYDDLYRLTRAQYSFNLPGQAARNDGVLSYRYDRIGNMLAQTSTFTNTDPRNGLPIENLGTMDSGGTSGSSGRIGRQPADPPGPHALTSIRNPQSAIRNYLYDPSGNMLTIDGLACTWDFKDRLVAVENDQMRAEYSYDCTDRRISKRVKKKSLTPAVTAR